MGSTVRSWVLLPLCLALVSLSFSCLRGSRVGASALLLIAMLVASGCESASDHNKRGNALYDKGEYDRAIEEYTRAIRLDPNFAIAYNSRGIAWYEKGEYDRAIEDFTGAIRLDPESADAYNSRGRVWSVKEEYDLAITDLTEAIRLDPDFAIAYNNRGLAWDYKGEYDREIEDYTRAIRLDPESAISFDALAWLWATCPDGEYRDGERAVEYGTKACELSNWDDGYIISSLAAAYAEAGDFDLAVETMKKALHITPRNIDLYAFFQERLELFENNQPYHQTPIR